ncbi:unnamed protein product [Lactuca saligna]|uniref:Uncharacterized protein n=1 Tax=Lactuca saligna TaxID=75948 RepID=A0AA35ZK22_LACSI|nr:unnamed protein product [Lactuca saligna]
MISLTLSFIYHSQYFQLFLESVTMASSGYAMVVLFALIVGSHLIQSHLDHRRHLCILTESPLLRIAAAPTSSHTSSPTETPLDYPPAPPNSPNSVSTDGFPASFHSGSLVPTKSLTT